VPHFSKISTAFLGLAGVRLQSPGSTLNIDPNLCDGVARDHGQASGARGMLDVNRVYQEEIEVIYRRCKPPFELAICPAVI